MATERERETGETETERERDRDGGKERKDDIRQSSGAGFKLRLITHVFLKLCPWWPPYSL